MASGNSQSKHTSSPSNNRKSKAKKSEKKLLPLPPFFHPLQKALERNELCRIFSFALFLFYFIFLVINPTKINMKKEVTWIFRETHRKHQTSDAVLDYLKTAIRKRQKHT